jgi:transposase
MRTDRKKNGKKNGVLPTSLPAIQPKVAGIDVGSSQHWVCGPAKDDGKPNVKVFATTTDQLNQLADWLIEQGVESVAMESTYVYWIPIYELLESRGVRVLLVNARQLHNGATREDLCHILARRYTKTSRGASIA